MPRWQRVLGHVGVGRGSISAAMIACGLLTVSGCAATPSSGSVSTPTSTPSPTPTVSLDPGDLWKGFAAELADLGTILAFVGGYLAVLLILARLLAFAPVIRDPRSSLGWRRTTWVAGLLLVVLVAGSAALRGLWIMRATGPAGVTIDASGPGSQFGPFLQAVFVRSGFWWALVMFSALAVAILAFAIASRQGVTIKLTSKDGGEGLDSAHILAAMDGMAGRPNRGIEFPIGTDITTAAGAVSELSSNKAVAALQVVVAWLLGLSPWTLAVDNEGADAASVTISRNGTLIKAKRVRIAESDHLDAVDELTKAEQLAALIGGELIAVLRTRYRRDFDEDLSGATDGGSIALHYIASRAFDERRIHPARDREILERAVELDPQNRAAWATLMNLSYRDASIHRPDEPAAHVAYRDRLDTAIAQELVHGPNGRGPERTWTDQYGREVRARATTRMLRRNTLLLRLLQARAAAAANALATGTPAGVNDAAAWALHAEVGSGEKRSPGPGVPMRRWQLLLVGAFRDSEQPALLADGRFSDELRAWQNPGLATDDATALRIAREDAALGVRADFRRDALVSYALACVRAMRLERDRASGSASASAVAGAQGPLETSIADLLVVAAGSAAVREWYPVDPEMTLVRGTAMEPAAMCPKPEEPAPEEKPEDESLLVLTKRLLAHLAEPTD